MTSTDSGATNQSQMDQQFMRLVNDVNALEKGLVNLNDALAGVLVKKYTLENYRNEVEEEPELADWPAKIRGCARRIETYSLLVADIRRHLAI